MGLIFPKKKKADSDNNWRVEAKTIDQATFDLSVKNPNSGEKVKHRSPKEIMKEIAALDKNGSISRSEYMSMNRISHTVAHQELKELLEKKIVKTKGAGKFLKYELTQG